MNLALTAIYFSSGMFLLYKSPLPTVYNYLIIGLCSFLLLINKARGSIWAGYLRLPHTRKDFILIIPITIFLLFWSGAAAKLSENWPLNLFHLKSLSGLVGAPFGEELLFRGLILATLSSSHFFTWRPGGIRYLPSSAAIISSVLFALWHIPLYAEGVTITILAGHFVFGFFLAWCVEQTRSLPATMLIHSICNSFWIP